MHCVKQNPIPSNQLDFVLYETVLLINQTNLLYRFVDKVISPHHTNAGYLLKWRKRLWSEVMVRIFSEATVCCKFNGFVIRQVLPLFTDVMYPAVRKHWSSKEIESERKLMNASNDKLIG